jgi:Family of unknown function (DUF6459)
MLPTAAPALRANFEPTEFDARDQTRAHHARAGLPAPAGAAARFAVALCEVEAGMRPAGQLERACHHTLYEKLAERVWRSGGPAVTAHSLVDVITQEQTPGLVDAVVLLRRGQRVDAVTMRLDAAPGHWQITELQYGRFPERDGASSPPAPSTSRAPERRASRHGEATARSAQARCGSTLGGREALKHACDLPHGHEGRCSWWEWHQERVARHAHAPRWRHHLSPPPFRLADYQDFLADRLAHARHHPGQVARPVPAVRPPERSQQRGGDGHER